MKLPTRDLEEVAACVAEGAAGFGEARILVTGGTGFVGRWLVESLLHMNASRGAGNRISVLSRDPAAFLVSHPHLQDADSLEWIEGSTAALDGHAAGAGPARFDLVIHAATPSSADLAAGDPGLFVGAIEGTRRVLEHAVRVKARRFLYLSSGAVYGRQPAGIERLEEDFRGAPDPSLAGSVYGELKRAGELLCAGFARHHGLETIIARGFAFIGPGLPLSDKFAAGSFLRDSLEGRAIRVEGDGTPIRSYMYASDMAGWLWSLLLNGQAGRAYNVGSEGPVSIAELASESALLGTAPLPVAVAKTAQPDVAPERYVPSTARARSELGLRETVDWREALRRTYAWNVAMLSPHGKVRER